MGRVDFKVCHSHGGPFAEGILLLLTPLELFISNWATSALTATVVLTVLILFMPIRRLFSWLFTGIDLLITGRIWAPLIKKQIKAAEYFFEQQNLSTQLLPAFDGFIHLCHQRLPIY